MMLAFSSYPVQQGRPVRRSAATTAHQPPPERRSQIATSGYDGLGPPDMTKFGDVWRGMHRVAAAYPPRPSDADRRHSRQWYESLGHLIPCPHCRAHYLQLFYRTFRNESRQALFQWTVDAHNAANERLGKPRLDAAEAYAMYAID